VSLIQAVLSAALIILGLSAAVWPTNVEGFGMFPVHDRWHMAGAFCARNIESLGARFSNLSQLY
jgi:hypothetical protein